MSNLYIGFTCLESSIGNTVTDFLLTNRENTLDNIPHETKLAPYFSTDPSNGDAYTMDAYIPLEMLGKGGFSKVYLVRKADTGKIYAMKIISKKFASKWKGQLVRREFDLMKEVSHPLVVELVYVFPTETTYNFVLEYCPGGTLYHNLKQRKKFSQQRALIYFAEMLFMTRYLHKNNILFRDFKAENVLLDYYGHLKLTDFGLARKFQIENGPENYSFCGSPIYIAPETLERKPYDHKVDYYALGILLYEMLTGLPPYNFKKADLIKKAKINQKINYPSDMDKRVVEVMKGCLERDPARRVDDLEWYKRKLKPLGVDMDVLQRDRYNYMLSMNYQFKKPRAEF